MRIYAVFILLVLLQSCAKNESDELLGQNTHGAAKEIVIGYLPSLAASPLYLAVAEGYFEKEGLAASLRPIYSGPDTIIALQSGSVDFVFSIVPSLLIARDRGVEAVSVFGATLDGPNIREHRLVLSVGSPVNSVSDLSGGRIAVVAKNTSDYFALVEFLERNGVDPESVEYIATPHPEILASVASGSVDAGAAIEPFISIGTAKGIVQTFEYYYPEDRKVEVGTYLVMEKFALENKEVVARFQRAIAAGVESAQDSVKLKALLPNLRENGIQFSVPEEAADILNIMDFEAAITEDRTMKTCSQLVAAKVVGFCKEFSNYVL